MPKAPVLSRLEGGHGRPARVSPQSVSLRWCKLCLDSKAEESILPAAEHAHDASFALIQSKRGPKRRVKILAT